MDREACKLVSKVDRLQIALGIRLATFLVEGYAHALKVSHGTIDKVGGYGNVAVLTKAGLVQKLKSAAEKQP